MCSYVIYLERRRITAFRFGPNSIYAPREYKKEIYVMR